jgi:hypothetical protein
MTDHKGIESPVKARRVMIRAVIIFVVAESIILFYWIETNMGNITSLPGFHSYFYHFFKFMLIEPSGLPAPNSNRVPFEFDTSFASMAGWQTVQFREAVWLSSSALLTLSITTAAIFIAKLRGHMARASIGKDTALKRFEGKKSLMLLVPLLAIGVLVAYYWLEILVGNIIYLPGFHYIFVTYFEGYLDYLALPVLYGLPPTGPLPSWLLAEIKSAHLAIHFIWIMFNTFTAILALIGIALYNILRRKTDRTPPTTNSKTGRIQ